MYYTHLDRLFPSLETARCRRVFVHLYSVKNILFPLLLVA
jgi:hypothetical protein